MWRSPSSPFAGGDGFGGGGERTSFSFGGDEDAHGTASCQWFCVCGSESFPAQTTCFAVVTAQFCLFLRICFVFLVK